MGIVGSGDFGEGDLIYVVEVVVVVRVDLLCGIGFVGYLIVGYFGCWFGILLVVYWIVLYYGM